MAGITGIALDRNRSGRFELVATSGGEGSGDTVWLAREVDDDGVEWTRWQGFGRLDGGTFSPAIYRRHAEGSLEAVVVDHDMNIWRRWQTDTGAWSEEWSSLEAPAGEGSSGTTNASPRGPWPSSRILQGLTLTQNADGRLEVFVGTQDRWAWHRWQKSEGSTAPWREEWSPFGLPDGLVEWPVVVDRIVTGHLAAFAPAHQVDAVDAEVHIWHRWQLATPGGGWSRWTSLGRPPGGDVAGRPVVADNADGRLEVFIVTGDGAVWHRWQKRADDPESWEQPWQPLGSQAGGFTGADVTMDARSRLTLVAVSQSGHDLWQRAQVAPNGRWGEWAPVATVPTGPLEQPTLYRRRNGGLGLFLVDGSTGGLHQRIQLQPDGDWGFRRDWEAPSGAALSGGSP
jgi:hypothetical protein